MEKLYEQYGRLLIQSEIINSQIAAVKQQIANELNRENENGTAKK